MSEFIKKTKKATVNLFKVIILFLITLIITLTQLFGTILIKVIFKFLFTVLFAVVFIVTSFFCIIFVIIGLSGDVYDISNVILVLFSVFGINNPTDELSINIISNGSKLLALLLPVSLTIYIFAFREQKVFSVSSVNNVSKHLTALLFLLLSIGTIMSGLVVSNIMYQDSRFITNEEVNSIMNADVIKKITSNATENYKKNSSEEIVKENYLSIVNQATKFSSKITADNITDEEMQKLIDSPIKKDIYDRLLIRKQILISIKYFTSASLWLSFFILSIVVALSLVINVLRNLNIRWQFQECMKQINDNSSFLLYIFKWRIFKSVRKYSYGKLHYYIECIYQMLMFCLNNKIYELYNENLKKLYEFLFWLHNKRRSKFFDQPLNYLYFNKVDPEEFQLLYKIILRNQISLILYHYEKYQIEEMRECIDIIFDIYPVEAPVELKTIYFNTLFELSLMLCQKDLISIEPILNRLNKIKKEDAINIYQLLLIQAIKRNDMNFLSTIAYSLTKNNLLGYNSSNDFAFKIHNGIMKQYNNLEVLILLKTLLKSIELSLHSTSGFLVKFIVTNFDSNQLLFVLSMFNSENIIEEVHHNPKCFLNNEPKHIIDNSFKFNPKSFDYCLQKMKFLLLGQQLYVFYINFQSNDKPVEYINLSNEEVPYYDYLFGKFKKTKDKYSLLYLQDKAFMKLYKQILLKKV